MQDMTTMATTYDVALLTGDTEYLRPFAERIHAERVKGVEAAAEIGRTLIEAKAATKHGHWLTFLQATGIEERTAQRAMKVARLVDKNPDKLTSARTVRGLLESASQTMTGAAAKAKAAKPASTEPEPEPAQVIDVTPEPEPAKSDNVSDSECCEHCGAPRAWIGLVRAEEWRALVAAADVADAADAAAA